MQFRNYFWTQGSPWRQIRSFVVPRLLRILHSMLMCTLRITTTGCHQTRPYLERETSGGALFVLWHDHTFIPLHIFRHRNIGVMMSTSRAGQMQAAFWNLYGWPPIWGSTKKREGIQALRNVRTLVRSGQSFGFTPDGPKGPRHHAQPGVVFLASKSPAPVMPIAIAASAYWQLPTWDLYLIPKPFSRVHLHVGVPLQPGPNLTRDETEEWRAKIEDALNEAQSCAHAELARRSRHPVAPFPSPGAVAA